MGARTRRIQIPGDSLELEMHNCRISLAVLRVERWLEELHDRRRLIEASFRSRKTQLEQCLALALLATDLRELEEILNDRIAALASSCDQMGDSASSAELLLFELKKLQAEAKVRSIVIVGSFCTLSLLRFTIVSRCSSGVSGPLH